AHQEPQRRPRGPRAPARLQPDRHARARDRREPHLRGDRDLPGGLGVRPARGGREDLVGGGLGLLPAAAAGGARRPAAGLHRGRAALRRPHDRGAARAGRRAVPPRRDHRLDQGDRRPLGRGGQRTGQGPGVRRPHRRDRPPRGPRRPARDHLLPVAPKGAGAGRGRCVTGARGAV
ncbi:MAG: hypothetical protein AVDCRST_MAG52-177, partial [uncultured Blastococcus sp.]